jgi:hypothetical protein
VLPLWPKSLHVFISPGECWIEHAVTAQTHAVLIQKTDSLESILNSIDNEFNTQPELLFKQKEIRFTVSDFYAVSTHLPWQDELQKQEEIQNYARLCLGNAVTKNESDWVIHAQFSSFRKNSIAYAFTSSWLQQLVDFSKKHKLNLVQVLPLSARIFFSQSNKRQTKCNSKIILISEVSRTTALLYCNHNLHSIDIEPVLQSRGDSSERLLRRIEANLTQLHEIELWASYADDLTLIEAAIRPLFNEVNIIHSTKRL